ncbi:MAG: nicotinate-nucleotide--dimethylbenzimidazole phosphoribosyltransferase [Clostridia bacterium]
MDKEMDNQFKARPIDEAAARRAQEKWDAIAKPLNSLGKLEKLIVQIAGLAHTAQVDLSQRSVLVLCADNGVVSEGVTQSGAEVTALVAESIAAGNGNICAMARAAGARVIAVDVGMLTESAHGAILVRKAARGTENIAQGPAMTRAQARAAIDVGIELCRERVQAGDKLLITGEMGIGNTTTSSAMAHVLLNRPIVEMTGRGAGLDDAGLLRKISAIERAISVNRPDPTDALDVLSKLGGYDIAAMAGVFLGGALLGVPVLIDGFISGVAALTAYRLCPESRRAMIATHVSREPASRLVLDALGLAPIIHAEMALGEGTGAITLVPLLDLALSVYRQAGTFESIHVAPYAHFEEEPPCAF